MSWIYPADEILSALPEGRARTVTQEWEWAREQAAIALRRLSQKRYRLRNPKRTDKTAKARAMAWKKKNPERAKEIRRRYMQGERAKMLGVERVRRYRAKKKGAMCSSETKT